MNDMMTLRRDAPHCARVTSLLRDGYLIIENIMGSGLLAAIKGELAPCFEAAPFSEGAFYGETTRRFGRILARSDAAHDLVVNPEILAIVRAVLDGPIQLNLGQAIEICPGAPVQPPHRDQDMWGCSKEQERTYMINVMWTLDPFTAENGATRIWPHSHTGPHDLTFPNEADAISVSAPPGSAILFLGQTLHSGGANRSAQSRRGLIFSYCLNWLLPDENPWLAYPPDLARRFDPEVARLIGYHQRHAGLNNFEGRDPAILLSGKVNDIPGFKDAMSPEQDAFILQYYDSLRTAGGALDNEQSVDR